MALHRFESRPATKDEEAAAHAVLKLHAEKAGGLELKFEPFSVLAFSGNELIGGVIGKAFWGWLYADLVWIEEAHRGQGLGKEIMIEVENKARAMKLTGIYLWTATWEAPDFYPKLGYEKFVEFENFPPGQKRFGFRKYL